MITCWAGKDNFAADRVAAEAMLKIYPDTGSSARANRAFLGRAVRYLAGEAGIRQFLDIGTGIPTAGNTHEVAQAIAPASRVAYVDYDPVVLFTHGASDLIDPEALQGLYDSFKGKVQQQFQWRTSDQVARFFAGADLVEPGLAEQVEHQVRGEADPAEVHGHGGGGLGCHKSD